MYDERSSVLEESAKVCATCGGTGRAPPKIEIRPGSTPTAWAWEIGTLT
jgi:hypothetical protein